MLNCMNSLEISYWIFSFSKKTYKQVHFKIRSPHSFANSDLCSRTTFPKIIMFDSALLSNWCWCYWIFHWNMIKIAVFQTSQVVTVQNVFFFSESAVLNAPIYAIIQTLFKGRDINICHYRNLACIYIYHISHRWNAYVTGFFFKNKKN